MTAPFKHFADLPAELPPLVDGTIISRTFYEDKMLKAVLFGFGKGEELSEHTSARAAVIHILQGAPMITLGEERFLAQPGTWIHMQPKLPHSIRAEDGPVVMLLYMYRDA